MKKILLSIAVTILTISQSFAYDIGVTVDSVHYIFYNITSSNTVEVTFFAIPGFDYYYYQDTVVIPSSIVSGGNTYNVTGVGSNAFYNCTNLTSVTLPSSITYIGENAFNGCSTITSFTVPSSVLSVGENAFDGCSYLSTLYFNAVNCTTVTNTSYSPWTGISNLVLGDSVQVIPIRAFYGCTNLTDVVIPNSVTKLDKYSFGECTALDNLTIGNSVVEIGDGAFYRCNSIESIVIPDSVTKIGSSAFSECGSIETIIIPNSVTSIGGSAFYGCSSLEYLTIGKSVIEIGDNAFQNCESIKTILIPNSVTSIGQYAFSGNKSATYIEIGTNVFAIGQYAFADCIAALSMRSKCQYPPTIDATTFNNTPKVRPFYVPCATLAAYQSDANWSSFQNIIEDSCGFRVTALPADATMGLVYGEGNYQTGETAILTAVPFAGYHFEHWNDGLTDNPRYVTVTCDSSFIATFALGAAVDDISDSYYNIYSENGQIIVSGAANAAIRVFDMLGRTVFAAESTSNSEAIPVPASGIYMVQVGNSDAQRIAVIR